MPWFVYMLRCEPDTLYTGSTPDLQRRLRQHCEQTSGGAKYTRSHPPKALAAVWTTPDAHSAHSLEWHIKRLTRRQKEALVIVPQDVSSLLGSCADGAEALNPNPYNALFSENT